MSDVACPDCGSGNTCWIGDCGEVVEATAPEYADWCSMAQRLMKTQLFKCNDCFLIFRSPAPSAEELRGLYSRIPAGRWDYAAGEVGGWYEAVRILRKKYSGKRPLRVLDIGSYDGKFLASLPDEIEKSAIEPAKSVIDDLNTKGVQWIGNTAADCVETHKNHFDVITLFDVFEHLTNPRRELYDITKLLAYGGILLIATGNAEHWTWQRLRGKHWYLHTLQHLCFGGPAYFRMLAAELGLEVDAMIRHPHKRCGLILRIRQSLETWHFAARNGSGPQRKLAGMIQRLPGAAYLIHRETGPFSQAIHDHLLVAYRKTVVR